MEQFTTADAPEVAEDQFQTSDEYLHTTVDEGVVYSSQDAHKVPSSLAVESGNFFSTIDVKHKPGNISVLL